MIDEQQSYGVFRGYTRSSQGCRINILFSEGDVQQSRQAVYNFQYDPQQGGKGSLSVRRSETILNDDGSFSTSQQGNQQKINLGSSDLEMKLREIRATAKGKMSTELDFRNYLRQFELKK